MTSEAGRDYLSVSIDDPSFPAMVYDRLIANEVGTHDLIWSRSNSHSAPPIAAGCLRWLTNRGYELAFSFSHQHRRTAVERAGDLEDDRQRGHVLATLDLAYVRMLAAGLVRQRILRDAAPPDAARAPPRRRREPTRRHGWWSRPAALNGSLLHRQNRQVAAQLKPRCL